MGPLWYIWYSVIRGKRDNPTPESLFWANNRPAGPLSVARNPVMVDTRPWVGLIFSSSPARRGFTFLFYLFIILLHFLFYFLNCLLSGLVYPVLSNSNCLLLAEIVFEVI